MPPYWKVTKFLVTPGIFIILLWYGWSWYITSGQRIIERSLLQYEGVEAVQLTYYEGAALELNLWLENGGFIHGSGISPNGLKIPGRGTISQIGDARISCANAERAQTYEGDEDVSASLFEIGSMLDGDANFSLFELIDNYNEVEATVSALPNSYSLSPKFELSSSQFKDIYPNATQYEGYNSFIFVCRKYISRAKVIPHGPGEKIRSAKYWFHRKE